MSNNTVITNNKKHIQQINTVIESHAFNVRHCHTTYVYNRQAPWYVHSVLKTPAVFSIVQCVELCYFMLGSHHEATATVTLVGLKDFAI